MDDLLDNAPCGYLAFQDDGSIESVNATLCALIGYGRDALLGRHVESILAVGSRVFYQTHLFPLLRLRGSVEEIYLLLRSHEGSDVPVLLNAVRRERGGSPVNECAVVTMRQRSRFEDEIIRARKETTLLRERERHIADILQEALRPPRSVSIPGLEIATYYRPALDEASIGGDFYDVYALDADRYVIVVADLSGKGLAAAAQIATVRYMLRTLLYLGMGVADALTRLNDMIAERQLLSGFATLFAGVYEPSRRLMTYACCGQEPGLVYRPATGAVDTLDPTGPVLGGFGGAFVYERSAVFADGDILALFTDGITEAGPNRRNLLELPGVTRLFTDAIAEGSHPDALVAAMIRNLEAYATPAGIRDDLCLVVARTVGTGENTLVTP